MRSPEEVKREIYEKWIRRANEDLAVAGQLLADGVPYFGAIGFHAQQAAEKFLKAFLVWHQVEFPKTHDLGQLLQLVETRDKALSESLHEIVSSPIMGSTCAIRVTCPTSQLTKLRGPWNWQSRPKMASASPYPVHLQPPATAREKVVRPAGANHSLLKV